MNRSYQLQVAASIVFGLLMGSSDPATAQTCPVHDFGVNQWGDKLRPWHFPASLGVEPGAEATSCVKLINFDRPSHAFALEESSRDAEYRINDGEWTTGNVSSDIVDGDEIYVRKRAPATYGAADTEQVMINGGYAGIWSIQTVNNQRVPTTWQVGPGRIHTQLSDIQNELVAGDIVELDGDNTYDAVEFTKSGTIDLPITIRGVIVNGNRPVITGDISSSKRWTVAFNRSHFYRLENLEITGADYACVRTRAHHVTIVDSYIHNCYGNGILSTDDDSGTLIIERTELGYVGNADSTASVRHAIYTTTDHHQHPDAKFVIKHSYIHNYRGTAIKSRANRAEVMFNWIAQTNFVSPLDRQDHSYYTLSLIGPDGKEPDAPIESIVMGNVFEHITTIRGGRLGLRFGGDGTGYSNGRVFFTNNVVIAPEDLGRSEDLLRVQFRMNSFYLRNNLFIRASQSPAAMDPIRLFRQEADWLTGEVLVYGENNWYPPGSALEPSGGLNRPRSIMAQWRADNSQDLADVEGVYFDRDSGVLTIPPGNTVLTDDSGLTEQLNSEYLVSGFTDYLDQPYRVTTVRPTNGALGDSLVTVAEPRLN